MPPIAVWLPNVDPSLPAEVNGFSLETVLEEQGSIQAEHASLNGEFSAEVDDEHPLLEL